MNKLIFISALLVSLGLCAEDALNGANLFRVNISNDENAKVFFQKVMEKNHIKFSVGERGEYIISGYSHEDFRKKMREFYDVLDSGGAFPKRDQSSGK